jgi:hypothetical protein
MKAHAVKRKHCPHSSLQFANRSAHGILGRSTSIQANELLAQQTLSLRLALNFFRFLIAVPEMSLSANSRSSCANLQNTVPHASVTMR